MVAVINSFSSTTFPVLTHAKSHFRALKCTQEFCDSPPTMHGTCPQWTKGIRCSWKLKRIAPSYSFCLLWSLPKPLSCALYICCQHMQYLLVFAIRTAIPIRNFMKNCFFAGLTHVASQPGALLRLVLNPWPKENNMVPNYQAGKMDNLLLLIFVANTQTGGGNLPASHRQ